jgi:hypothetical protein
MRHALAVLLTLILGVLAHPASAAERIAGPTAPRPIADTDRGNLGLDDWCRESATRTSVVAPADDRGEDLDDPSVAHAPRHSSIAPQPVPSAVAPAGDGPSVVAWRLSTVGPRGPPQS